MCVCVWHTDITNASIFKQETNNSATPVTFYAWTQLERGGWRGILFIFLASYSANALLSFTIRRALVHQEEQINECPFSSCVTVAFREEADSGKHRKEKRTGVKLMLF